MNPKSPFTADSGRPFKLVKFLSWSSLLLILASNLIMAVVISNSARETLLSKQREFSMLLAQNLNHQIFQRFTVPTILAFGRVQLSQPKQYDQMDKVVRATVHGQGVMELRIYDTVDVVAYSTNEELVSRDDLAGKAVTLALNEREHSFEIESHVSALEAMFRFNLEPESVVMRTVYPLVAERSIMPGGPSGQIMGVLEFTQDITEDYRSAIHFQWLVILISFSSALVLFLLLLLFIRKADAVNVKRMQRTQRLERELLQAEKLASMGRVVAGIAHEIRNPLGIIQSSAELLLHKAKAEESSRVKILQVMFDEIKRLSQTVNDFLDYARPKKPRQDDVDLVLVVEQARAFFEHEFSGAEVEVKRDLPSSLIVRGDQSLLYRVIFNIMVNAMQAMEGHSGTLTIQGSEEDDGIHLTFCDTGSGVPDDILVKIADPFFTTKDQGTGLGLAIVANILDSHGATLEFSNAQGGGACVRIVFPRPESRSQ